MTYPEWSSLIKVNSFIKRLKPIFSKEVGFCPPCQIKQWAFVQWDIVQWAFVLVGFCPSGLLSVPPFYDLSYIQTASKYYQQPSLVIFTYLLTPGRVAQSVTTDACLMTADQGGSEFDPDSVRYLCED